MKVLLVQLPIPRLNLALKTGNIPLGAAYLKQAAAGLPGCRVDILPELLASHAGDEALIQAIVEQDPDILGFTVFCWNLERSLYLAEQIKGKTRARIIFGGPEITRDNTLIRSKAIDFYVYGEGEDLFTQLLTSESPWGQGSGESNVCSLSLGSPYVNGYLASGIEMLLETQRGCPYRCGFCYYSKSRKTLGIVPDQGVLDGIAWAAHNGIDEIYLLDPSLNSRPGLAHLLEKIALLNRSGQISLISEIRAESVDKNMAELYRKAGFTGFEVGLQSTNPAALRQMNRPTDLKAFLNGIKHLQAVGIAPTVDLIFGLPGDTLAGFRQSLDFVAQNHLDDHLQVFPLLVLPGTLFRKNSRKLGLVHQAKPPYTLISSPGFTSQEMVLALDAAESAFDMSLCPFPDLEISFKKESQSDFHVSLAGRPHLSKLVLHAPRPLDEIQDLACQITCPFQIFFGPGMIDPAYQQAVIRSVSETNPFVPLEMVFIEPARVPDTREMLGAMALRRPHFLDHDLGYLYPEPGNRAVQFTLISRRVDLFFQGEMKRQVYLWDRDYLPGEADLEAFAHVDGILMDSPLAVDIFGKWQDRFSKRHGEFVAVNFARINLQIQWMEKTVSDRYQLAVLKGGR